MQMRYSWKKNPIVFGGGQRSSGVTRGQTLKTLLTRYLKLGNLDQVHTWYVDALWLEEEAYRFWWRSKVIWGHQRSKSENLVNTISQGRKLGQISYLECTCPMVRGRTLLCVVEVKGHLGSPEVKWSKLCKHCISARVTAKDLILSM